MNFLAEAGKAASGSADNKDGVVSIPPTPSNYKEQAMYLLKKEFPFLSVQTLKEVFQAQKCVFTRAFIAVQAIQADLDNNNTEDALERVCQQHPCLRYVSKIRLKGSRQSEKGVRINNQGLLAELEEIPQFNRKENAVPKRPKQTVGETAKKSPEIIYIPDSDDEEVKEESRNKTETGLECGCCFSECPIDTMVQCTEAHLFCVDCLTSYVNEQFFAKSTTNFKCMEISGSQPCQGIFNRDQLKKIPAKLLETLDKAEARIALTAVSSIQGCECPKCSYVGFVSDDDTGLIVQCHGCNHVYCRHCKEGADIHNGKTCGQVQKEKDDHDKKVSAINGTADAMTAAILRHCPICKLPVLKSEGCNKMTCPNQNCPQVGSKERTKFCYLCRQQIVDYNHFCRTPHCTHENCGKCILFTKSAEDDERAREKAGQAAVAKLQGTEGAAAACLLSSYAATGTNMNMVGGKAQRQQHQPAVQDMRLPQRAQLQESDDDDDISVATNAAVVHPPARQPTVPQPRRAAHVPAAPARHTVIQSNNQVPPNHYAWWAAYAQYVRRLENQLRETENQLRRANERLDYYVSHNSDHLALESARNATQTLQRKRNDQRAQLDQYRLAFEGLRRQNQP